jgi:hypothetical protein
MEGRKAQLLPGDGVLIEFGSVVGAVHCAIGLQKLTTERNAGGPGDRRMEWRIGIHLGDAGRRRRGGRSRWQMPKSTSSGTFWLATEPSATADPRRNKAPVASTAAVRSTTRPGALDRALDLRRRDSREGMPAGP